MPLSAGTRLGPYEILGPLGAGGMGEVYRSRDTRLDRIVAIKVLPQHLSASPEVRARFEREARAVSSLNHPHICTLHDIGSQGGTDYLVMEYIEGESLADRLVRGPLPTAELLRYAVQIADALDKAHRHGYVHRDLKPGNIMLTKSGAKLLDFGLARATGLAANAGNLSRSPTMSQPLTAEGTIVGTFQYMAPEQLEGKEADARTDLFAFGAVLYEMATGKRAFEGKSQASLISAIMASAPAPIATLQPLAPALLDRVVQQCLAKDPDDRIQTAHDVRLQLEWISEGQAPASGTGVAPAAVRHRATSPAVAWTIAALASAVALAVVFGGLLHRGEAPRRIVSAIPSPAHATLNATSGPMALSADGRQIAFVARAEGKNLLWIRPLDDTKARSLAGTEEAECPFWSPDGRSLGFFAQGKVKTVEVTGGQPEVIANARICLGASWGTDGSILFVPDYASPVFRVAAGGGDPVAVTGPGQSTTSRITLSWPSFLPDGRHFLYTVNAGQGGGPNSGIFVGSLDSKEGHRVIPTLSNARYAPEGFIVYAKDGALRAQAFDPARQEVHGEPKTLAEDVQYLAPLNSYLFSLSENGMLAYVSGVGAQNRRFAWFDRAGRPIETLDPAGLLYSPRLSRDGRQIAYDQSDPVTDSGDIWVYDLQRKIANRLTYEPANESAPVWSKDDSRLVFFRDAGGLSDLMLISSNGTGSPERLAPQDGMNRPSDWSPDGRYLVFTNIAKGGAGRADLWIYSFDDKKAVPWLQTPFQETAGRFSPDQRWLAYSSDESDRTEVYVRGFTPPGGKWRVSSDGGMWPVWRGDGRELFFFSPDGMMMSVEVAAAADFQAGAPRPLFRVLTSLSVTAVPQFDVAADGQRFLLMPGAGDEGAAVISLIANWPAAVRGN